MPIKVAIIGTGYVGLTTGVCFADLGHSVVGIDADAEKVARLGAGDPIIHEDGLKELLRRALAAGRIHFTTSCADGVGSADVIMIAVGTPSREDGHVDLTYVEQAALDLAPHLRGFTVVCVKSTVPAGTNRQVARLISAANAAADIAILSNPEFLREGRAIKEFMEPDRIVLGAEDERAIAVARALYQPLTQSGRPLVVTSIESAEVAKYAANTFLAARLALLNEFADICEQVGGDIEEVIEVLASDARIGPHFLRPGPGFGGSCFPKDVGAVTSLCQGLGDAGELIRTILPSNARRQKRLSGRILEACGGTPGRLRIGVLGLTFKAGTDDVRDSPSLAIIEHLRAAGAEVVSYDPAGLQNARRRLKGVSFVDEPYEVARGSDGLAVLTEWQQFAELNLVRLRALMRGPHLFDFRNILDRDRAEWAGFCVHPLGAVSLERSMPLLAATS